MLSEKFEVIFVQNTFYYIHFMIWLDKIWMQTEENKWDRYFSLCLKPLFYWNYVDEIFKLLLSLGDIE